MNRALWRWLSDIPVSNEIDKRNGAFFQLFLAYFGITIFTIQPTKYIDSDVQRAMLAESWGAILPWPRVGMVIDFSTDVAMACFCVIAFIMIRRGHFRVSVRLFLTSLLGLLGLNYLAFGSTMGTPYANMAQMIAALMLGRRALWIVYTAAVMNFALGTAADSFAHYYRQGIVGFNLYAIASAALNLFVVAAVLDQTVQALRDALSEARIRGDKLAAESLEREKSQQQVLHLEKMRTIGQLASGTAHDINNVLAVILGFARERRRPGLGSPQTPREVALSDALEGIEVAARRGAGISRKLLDFGRAEPARLQTFDVVEALEDARPMLRQLLPENVRLSIRTPPGATAVLFDRGQFELALLNLAANARDAMPKGGTCDITVARGHDDWILVILNDTGEGMSDETRRRVFEPFFTTKPVGIGTGLGLSVVHGLVERSGGRMSIDSVLGNGTTVTIWLRPGEHAEPTNQSAACEDVRVLLIDDDDVLRGILVSSLEDYGYQVTAAHDGRSALLHAEAMQDAPHVIVCDHYMPDMDGATVMRHLRERFPRVPAILISTGAPIGQSDTASAGVHHLPKPFSPDRLAMRIAEVVLDGEPGQNL